MSVCFLIDGAARAGSSAILLISGLRKPGVNDKPGHHSPSSAGAVQKMFAEVSDGVSCESDGQSAAPCHHAMRVEIC